MDAHRLLAKSDFMCTIQQLDSIQSRFRVTILSQITVSQLASKKNKKFLCGGQFSTSPIQCCTQIPTKFSRF